MEEVAGMIMGPSGTQVESDYFVSEKSKLMSRHRFL
jgi:hypothetical protein